MSFPAKGLGLSLIIRVQRSWCLNLEGKAHSPFLKRILTLGGQPVAALADSADILYPVGQLVSAVNILQQVEAMLMLIGLFYVLLGLQANVSKKQGYNPLFTHSF